MVTRNDFRLLTLGRLALLTPAGEEDASLGKQRRRLALLALLALLKRPLPRETLVEMFWGDQDETRARHSLDNALSHFRRVLGGDAFARRQTEVALGAAAPLSVDAAEMASAVAAGEYGRAAALYGGPFLDGVYVEGSVRFERWVEGERQRLEALFLDACQRECRALARAGRWRECAALAARWLETAPLSGDAALYLLNALDAPGTRDADVAALAEYERLRARLEREYELPPDDAVAALAADIAKRLEERAPAADAAPVPDPSSADGTDATAETRDPVRPVHPIEPPSAGRHDVARSRHRWLVPSLAGVALLVAAAVATRGRDAVSQRSVADPAATGSALAPRARIIVADFENHSRDSLLGVVVTQAIRVDLGQSPAVRVVPPGTVREALARMKRPAAAGPAAGVAPPPPPSLDASAAREVAVREGVAAVVTGDVASVGPRYVLTAQLLSSETGEVLAGARETAGDSTDIVRAVDRLSSQLRARLGESLESIRATPPLERVTTSSLEALRRYSLATRAYYVEGDYAKAAALDEEAVALDSTFAAAYEALGVMWINQADRRARAIDALTKAFRYRGQLTARERFLAEAAYYLRVTAEYDKAAAAYRALLDVVPDDQTALNNLGIAYGEMRDFARAEQTYRHAIELDSSNSFTEYANIAQYQVIFGRLAEAETTLARARAKFPGNPFIEGLSVGTLAARGDYAGAAAYLRRIRSASLGANDRTALASLAVMRGRLADAERELDDGMAAQAGRGAPQAALEVATLAGDLDVWLRGAPRRGVRKVEAALAAYPLAKMHPLDRPYLPLASFYALAGAPPTRSRSTGWRTAGSVPSACSPISDARTTRPATRTRRSPSTSGTRATT